MKTFSKTLWIVLLCTVVAPTFYMRASAQLNNNVDTIAWPWERKAIYNYFGKIWIDSVLHHPCATGVRRPSGYFGSSAIDLPDYANSHQPIIGRKYYTDTALRIIGAAVVFQAPQDTVGNVFGCDWKKSDYVPEYLHIMDGNDSLNHELRRASFSVWDSAKALCEVKYGDYSNWQDALNVYGKLIEVYFDSAVIVRDSFYVARTLMNQNEDWYYSSVPGQPSTLSYGLTREPFGPWLLMLSASSRQAFYDSVNNHGGFWTTRNTSVSNRYADVYYNYVDSARADSCKKICYSCWKRDSADVSIAYFKGKPHNYGWLCLFPIIDTTFVDTNKRPSLPPDPPQQPCDRVDNIQLYNTEDGMVTFTWLRGNHQAWEVNYRPAGSPPDSATIETVYSPFWTKDNLDNIWYDLFVRGICDSSSISDWSDGVRFKPNGRQLPCERVSDIQLYNTDDGMVSLTWLSNNHQAWEVSYGPAGTPPDSATIETVYSPFWTKFDLDYIWYDLYVRGICDSSSSSDWSDRFRFRPRGRHNDIATTNPDPANISILPNPSEGKVAVNAEAVILSIDLFNLSGVRLDSFEVNAPQAHLDLSLLPRGTYLLLVHTDKGSSVHKLVLM
ncbi:MAG: T9SS type A sorting domain-containing protein [Bacteroidales bacterium]|nr:T9SS type A sorting domain-containing protein [Bacteroidales bacterium]